MYPKYKQNKSDSRKKILIYDAKYYSPEKDMINDSFYYAYPWISKLDYSVSNFFYDEIQYKIFIKYYFFKEVMRLNPDLIILRDATPKFYHPNYYLMILSKLKINFKIIFMWSDTVGSTFQVRIKNFINHKYFDLHLFNDWPSNKDNFLSSLSSSDQKTIFYDFIPPERTERFQINMKKKYDVVFMGQGSSYRDFRNEYIEYLKDHLKDYSCFFSLKHRNDQIDFEEHDLILSQAKIGINFSESHSNLNQYKGRVTHTMLSRALLLESQNDEISYYFTPNKDFVFFTSKEDLLKKIKYYIKNEDERLKIASNGRSTYLEKYNPNKSWPKILKLINF